MTAAGSSADGYLTLEGRIKELINRGGEKISPHEVEDALLGHPAVAQAVAYAIPDAKYGEQVAAAVVVAGPTTADELRRHCQTQLAAFKVPVSISLVEKIPTGPTGKVQRRLLADLLFVRIAVLGAGAIGAYVGAALARGAPTCI